MSVDIEQRVEDLLKHTGVWDETKETLRELLAEHKAGKLDPEDARYIEGLHKKVFPGRNAVPGAQVNKAGPQGSRDVREVKADNDDALLTVPSSAAIEELISALRRDMASIVTPPNMPETEQTVRFEILTALEAKLDEYAAKEEG